MNPCRNMKQDLLLSENFTVVWSHFVRVLKSRTLPVSAISTSYWFSNTPFDTCVPSLILLHNSGLKSAAGSRTPNNVLILHSKPELGLFQEVAVCFCKNDPLFSDALLLLLPQLALLLMLDAWWWFLAKENFCQQNYED